MATKINVRNIDLRDTQEKVENRVRLLRDVGRKAALAYAGMWGLAYDNAVDILTHGQDVLNRAVERGQELESAANRRAQNVYAEARNRVKDAEERIGSLGKKTLRNWRRSERRAESEIEAQVERALERLGIPSRERILKLSAEIEALSRKIHGEIVVEREGGPEAPFDGYDELTAKEIVARMDEMTIAELARVREYEAANENRVTVLREAERRLEAMPIVGYDEHTVEELEPMLDRLNAEQLAYLARYEKTHQNRITLLRAIESEQEQRRKAVAA